MWDIFGFKRRKEAKLKARKEAYQTRKAMIDKWLDSYDNKQSAIARSVYKSKVEDAERANSICPKCGSTDVINKVRRLKGELNGKSKHKSDSTYIPFLFGAYADNSSEYESEVHGEMDTYPVNRCSHCGHEWKIEEAHYPTTTDDFNSYSSHNPHSLVFKINQYYDLDFDPNDITETCSSLAEKKQKYLKETVGTYDGVNCYRNVPRYMIEVAMYEALEKSYCHWDGFSDVPKQYGKVWNAADKYEYQMPDELWEMVKQLLHWNGEE